jgi:hypothetical protein
MASARKLPSLSIGARVCPPALRRGRLSKAGRGLQPPQLGSSCGNRFQKLLETPSPWCCVESQGRPRLAVLVDADQHLRSLGAIYSAASKEGVVAIPCAYTDWDQSDRACWLKYAKNVGFTPVRQPRDGANATDHAMSILYEKDIDGFWIASNGRGFFPLVRRLLSKGKTVAIVVVGGSVTDYPKDVAECVRALESTGERILTPELRLKASNEIDSAYSKCPSNGRGVLVTQLMQEILRQSPHWDVREYGYSSPIELLEALPRFKVIRARPGEGDDCVYRSGDDRGADDPAPSR